MSIKEQINKYFDSQPEPKRYDLQELHTLMLKLLPEGKLWFDDGKNAEGKIVSNPSVGYGSRTTIYADGKASEYYQVGLSGNTSGISVYILGIDDKTYLIRTYGEFIGKATVKWYCIKYKKLKDINVNILEEAIRFGLIATT